MKTRLLTTLALVLIGTTLCAAQNVSGTVTCGGVGIEGVAVSDGHQIVLTDADGHYSMNSDKQKGYVFYTLPSGYDPELADGFDPKFWATLETEDSTIHEVHDFALRRRDNDRHIVMLGSDIHLARRNNDRAMFESGMVASLRDEVTRADGIPVYSVLLGDLTWDEFWFQNGYGLPEFKADMRLLGYPVPLWPVIGNHDHDPSVPAGDNTDEEASATWRKIMGPTYYSFNLGKVHYIVLDDILYLNQSDPGEDYPEGIVGRCNYVPIITDEQLTWLEQDIAFVDKSSPIVLCMHIPAWSATSLNGYRIRMYDIDALGEMLSDFENVHIMSGHTHIYNTTWSKEYPNFVEHNLGASSGTLWFSGALTGHHICQDGSPAGFLRWSADGDDVRWQYKPIHEGESQMRLYDMNTVKDFYNTDSIMSNILKKYPTRVNYGKTVNNAVMVNVFNYDAKWKVDICEGDRLLVCTRIYTEDPFHTLAYDVPQYSATGTYWESFATCSTGHLFRAQAATPDLPITVRAIDSFGNIYLKSINRPHDFNLDMEEQEKTLTVGDVNMDGEVNIADIGALIDMIIENNHRSCPPVVSDCNGDNVLDLDDINTIITIIFNKYHRR